MFGGPTSFYNGAIITGAGRFVKVGIVVVKMGEGTIGLNILKNIGGSVGTTCPLPAEPI